MNEANNAELPPLPRNDSTTELPIRDAVQSHQSSDVRTNDYQNPSVFASVSPDVPPCLDPANNNMMFGTISNDEKVEKASDAAVSIDATADMSQGVHSSVQSSPALSLNSNAYRGPVLQIPGTMSQDQGTPALVPTGTKPKKRRRQNNASTPKSAGSEHHSSSAGRWTAAEHHAFVRGLAIYGREWKRVAQDIPTRTSAQVRSHAQKYFTKLEKQMMSSQVSSSYSLVTQENDRLKDIVATPRNHSLGSNSYSSSADEGEGMPNDGYANMSDSVRREAARILANPATVELEVRDTLEWLRIRYEQLKERLEVQKQQQSSPNRNSQDARGNGSNVVVEEDDELIALHVLQGLQQHVESKRSSHDTAHGASPPEKK